MEADSDHASPYAMREGSVQKIPMLKRLSAIAPAGAVQTSVRDLARWLTFHATRSPALLGEGMWRELHRPQAEMPAPDEPEVQHPYYALGWIHESYRGHPLVVHNGAIDGFTVHLGFLPETGQGLILLMNRDLATAALMALAYSAYDRLLGLEPLDWEERLKETPDTVAGCPGCRARLSDRRGGGEIRASRVRGAHGPGQRGQARDAVSDSSFHAGLSGRTAVSQPGTHRRRGPADLGSVLETEDWRASEALRSAQLR